MLKKLLICMKNTTEKTKKRVKVHWRDAQSFAEWLDPVESKNLKPAIIVSEGYLLEINKDVVILYMSYNDTDIGDTCVIPREEITYSLLKDNLANMQTRR